MLQILILTFLAPISWWIEYAPDPVFPLWGDPVEARSLECHRVEQYEGHELSPNTVPAPPARGQPIDGDGGTLVCRRRYLADGHRPARDEALLSTMTRQVGEITRAATGRSDGVLWHVDAFYPSPAVASKLAVAARTDLVERGGRVSDRVPLLAAGDILVLAGRPFQEAYPLACARYFKHGSLKAGEGLLGLMLLDPRETELHAGVCLDGEWSWLR